MTTYSYPTKTNSEFQAIVLPGDLGNQLFPLTEEDNVPIGLLPVANKPILHYVLGWLEKAGIRDVIIVAQTQTHQKIQHYLTRIYNGGINPELEVVEDRDLDTADMLRHVRHRIHNDFLVISCDLITDLPPHEFLDFYRLHDPTVAALFFEPPTTESPTPGKEKKRSDAMQFVGLSPENSQLVHLASSADIRDKFSLRTSLLWKFPRVQIFTTLEDAHVYIFKRWVLDFLASRKGISSVKDELIPILVKSQYRPKFAEREGLMKFAGSYEPVSRVALEYSSVSAPEVGPINCLAYVQRTGFCGRATSIQDYADLNRNLTKTTTLPRVPESAEAQAKAVGADSLVGEDTKIEERTSIKRSTVGSHCIIGKGVKISNSVVMDHVVIEDNVKLEGCIVCHNAKILERAQLKDCEVGGGYIVKAETLAKNEKLVGQVLFG
ncbi:uncharacterized protein VTP21DRAFT_4457 [Calcarisporiella thermophila]|uniref:uncharacterized protein n=1 Tax=Calcarisporiella thermophila TaxID=911321 RepID=UPI0037421334